MEATSCPRCGSKRTTAIIPTGDKPTAVWCHQCGAVTERQRDEWPLAVEEDDPIYAIWAPKGA